MGTEDEMRGTDVKESTAEMRDEPVTPQVRNCIHYLVLSLILPCKLNHID